MNKWLDIEYKWKWNDCADNSFKFSYVAGIFKTNLITIDIDKFYSDVSSRLGDLYGIVGREELYDAFRNQGITTTLEREVVLAELVDFEFIEEYFFVPFSDDLLPIEKCKLFESVLRQPPDFYFVPQTKKY